jgi:hypothetical protein
LFPFASQDFLHVAAFDLLEMAGRSMPRPREGRGQEDVRQIIE